METVLLDNVTWSPFVTSFGNQSDDNDTLITHSNSAAIKAVHLFVIPILFGIITLIGVFGNCLVIYVILAENKWRTVMNIMLLNLAISDLSFVLVCPPFTAYRNVVSVLNIPMSGALASLMCKLMQYLLNVCIYVTIYTLVLISIIRYMAFMHAEQTERFRTHKAVVIYILIIWLIIAHAHIPILMHYGIYEGVCSLKDQGGGRWMFAQFTALAYVLPLCVILIFSLSVRKQLQKKPSFRLTNNKSSYQTKIKASRLLVAIAAMFATLWLPIHLLLNLGYWEVLPDSQIVYAVVGLAQCMAYANSCANPIIYNFMSKDFRTSFHRVIFCQEKPRQALERHEVTRFLRHHQAPQDQQTHSTHDNTP